MNIFTIGHSNHTQEVFLDLLAQVKIEVLVDVRSNPNSRWASFANRYSLENILRASQIQYIYMGDVLGGQPSEPDKYNPQTGKVDYQKIQNDEHFRSGIRRILVGLTKYRVCIMCAEEDPTNCHCNLLVAESLRQEGVTVLHIRGDRRIQTDEELFKENVGIAANQSLLPL